MPTEASIDVPEDSLTEEQLSAHNSILIKIRCDACHETILVLTDNELQWTVAQILDELKEKEATHSYDENGIRFLTCASCIRKPN